MSQVAPAPITFDVPTLADFAARAPAAPRVNGEANRRPRRKAVRGIIPQELPLDKIVAVIDTREQLPHDLAPLRMETGTLATGDYSVRGLENFVAIERKSLPDFVACCGVERERFERCVQRLLAYPTRAIVIEASRADLEAGAWRSKISAASVLGSYWSWQAMGVPIVLSGHREQAARDVAALLTFAARRRWAEARELITAAQRIETEGLCEEIL